MRLPDAGDDVLSVVGLTSSISLVSATFEQLGLASVGGRHVVIRGYADVEERKVFEAAFTELRAEERDLLYQSRRATRRPRSCSTSSATTSAPSTSPTRTR